MTAADLSSWLRKNTGLFGGWSDSLLARYLAHRAERGQVLLEYADGDERGGNPTLNGALVWHTAATPEALTEVWQDAPGEAQAVYFDLLVAREPGVAARLTDRWQAATRGWPRLAAYAHRGDRLVRYPLRRLVLLMLRTARMGTKGQAHG